jgi:Ca2+-binding EF-hand superfamily protein
MGNFIEQMQKIPIPQPNRKVVMMAVSRIKSLHKGFQMLCDSFALTLPEFEQVFALDESVFAIWDTDCNGMIDALEFFSALILFSQSKLEDKIRTIFELFDFNEKGYL